MTSIVRRLATSQARGERQLSFINELLPGNIVHYRVVPIPGAWYGQTTHYGVSRLPYKSWSSLRRRLVSVGFVIENDRQSRTVKLLFPEFETLN